MLEISHKELSLCHKLCFYNPYIFAKHFRRPLIFSKFQTMNSIKSNNLSLKFQRVTPSEAEFKEFEPRLKFETQLKYGWFQIKFYLMFQDLSQP